jgi:replicative DNA helicase
MGASKGLPANLDAERFVLGSILLDDVFYVDAGSRLSQDDFSHEAHRRIFRRMVIFMLAAKRSTGHPFFSSWDATGSPQVVAD